MSARKLSLVDVLMLTTAVALAVAIFVPGRSMSDNADKLKKCGSNLRFLGQAMYIYAQDGDYFPVMAKTRKENDGAMVLFAKETRDKAPGNDSLPSPTVDLYSLLRANNATPKQFVCPLTKDEPDPGEDTSVHYDFLGSKNLSYAYQYQYDPDRPALGTGSNPAFPLMADSNPYIKGAVKDEPLKDRLSPAKGNSMNHDEERPSQNVLFLDGHVTLYKRPDVGLQGPMDRERFRRDRGMDNIYTVHEKDKAVDPGSAAPTSTKCNLGSRSDACLVP